MFLEETRSILEAQIDMGKIQKVTELSNEDKIINEILSDSKTVCSDYDENKEMYKKVTFADKKGNIYHIDLSDSSIQKDITKLIWKDKDLKVTDTNDNYWVQTFGKKALEDATGRYGFYTSDNRCKVIPLYKLVIKLTSPEAFRILSTYKQNGRSLHINHMLVQYVDTGFEKRIIPYEDTSQIHPDYLEIITGGQNLVHAELCKEYKDFFANPVNKRVCSYFMVKEASLKIERQNHADFTLTNNMLNTQFPESTIR